MTHDGEVCVEFEHLAKHGVEVGGNVAILVRYLLSLLTFSHLHLDVGIGLRGEGGNENVCTLVRVLFKMYCTFPSGSWAIRSTACMYRRNSKCHVILK